MANTVLQAAYREALASANRDVAIIDSIEVTHPIGGTHYLVNNKADLTLTDEDTNANLHTATSFRIGRPKQGETGAQELTIVIDNVNRTISDFLETIKDSQSPLVIKWRPYLSSDLTTPQISSPLELTVVSVSIDAFTVSARARFVEIVNRPFINERFTRTRFPGLGD